ncbi:MAG: CAF17-like 4Fe-4S cluster assembly/insertion protein YgfZ [Acidimicrobiales bacterium]
MSDLVTPGAREVSGEIDYAVWLERDFVAVSGPDSQRFLQGQLSQDLNRPGGGGPWPSPSAWSLLLAPQGRMVALVRAWAESADTWMLDVDPGVGPAVVERLVRFKLRVKAELSLHTGWQVLGLRGPGVAGLATGPPPSVDADVRRLDASWRNLAGVDLVGPAPTPPDGFPLIERSEHEVRRILAGMPVVGREITEATIPAEAGVVEPAVSFTKGCYTGQELVARLDSRGSRVARHLRRLLIEAGPEADLGGVEVSLTANDATVGRITSAAWSPDHRAWLALGYVARAVEVPAMEVPGPGAPKLDMPAPVVAEWEGGRAAAAIFPLPRWPGDSLVASATAEH